MELSPENWFLFPISVLIATIAMSSGIGGAVFFSPLFMLGLKLDPNLAIGSALVTELFGFTSGLIAYIRARLIDFRLAWSLLAFSIPAAILGSLYASLIPDIILKSIFALGLMFLGYQLYLAWKKEHDEENTQGHAEDIQGKRSSLIDATGRRFEYTVCRINIGRAFAAIGGAFVGMISVGLAELQEYHLVGKCKVPAPVAVGTSVFIVVITVLVASAGHFYHFLSKGPEIMGEVLNIIMFTVPGVIIGGQIGPMLQKRIPEDKMKVSIALAFMIIGVFILTTLINF